MKLADFGASKNIEQLATVGSSKSIRGAVPGAMMANVCACVHVCALACGRDGSMPGAATVCVHMDVHV